MSTRIQQSNPPASERTPFWEISPYLSCPVIGTCISIKEQRKMLKKARVNLKDLSDHDVHERLVQSCHSDSPLSRRIQRYLDNKFNRQISEFGSCSEAEFYNRWRAGLRQGEVEDLLWVGATNPNLSESSSNQIFTDMHMLMHRQGELVREKFQESNQLKAKNQQLTADLKAARLQERQAAKDLAASQRANADLTYQIENLQAELEALKSSGEDTSLREENQSLQIQLEKSQYDFQTRSTALKQVKAENVRISTELAAQTEMTRHFQSEIQRLLRELRIEDENCQNCPNRELCEQRVLLVGGISKLRAVYQNLVEGDGGEFKYHDGGTNGGERNLQNLVGWADVVLCPVDVNSHGAALGVKKMCKKLEKPYFMLRSSSVSSIARALDNVAETVC